ncbi:N2227-like protein-domain-containing protein [Lentinula lateritia]|uniref:N2227-like protein-domain-containing protein n=1 Tax=Lentinula aff. lateritia TaxID=2804960 RepID=A0ACC1U8D6_9AGAR|nr:N2227-like protein-domain-containing protein [Lentinula aff. lateritia]KAJ3857707.1 N2227-like protein-domain-containing protein [Lentinula lateritia]
MSDILIACLFPAMLLYLGLRMSVFDKAFLHSIWFNFLALFKSDRTPNISSGHGPFSVQTSSTAYSRYRSLSLDELSRMRASYTLIGRTHKRIGYEIGYTKKLDRLGELIQVNAKATDGIVTVMRRIYAHELSVSSAILWPGFPSTVRETSIDSHSLSRIRETLKHFVRDWSDAGSSERSVIFQPILSALSTLPAPSRSRNRVLVPGSGLGRLAHEISQLGYDVDACELSAYMNGAFRFLLDPEMTTTVYQHEIHPYAHWWSHSRNTTDLFRGIRFPDVIPRLAEDETVGLHLMEGDFLALNAPKPPLLSNSSRANGYDLIVTLFFIDTSVNILSTLEQIHKLLKPGGTWVNLGPLLWCSSAQARLELTLEELFDAMEAVGFAVAGGRDGKDDDEPDCMKRRTIPCEYTHDDKAMMRWIYEAEFWVARKV